MYSRLSKSRETTGSLQPVELTEYNTSINHDNNISKNNINKNVKAKKERIIRLRNIHKTYLLGLEGVPALRGVSLTIYRGEFIVILGKSGGGKTSMLNIMGTIDKPTKGDIYISGKRISSSTTDTEVANLRLKKIGFCFQTFNLISSMTALENVELPMILNGKLSSKEIRKRATKLLTHVGLENRANHLPSQLSGGEQQRVTISRAIANNPDVLLLDEPTGDLDTKNSNIIMDLLIKLNREENITAIFVTHDVALKYYAHRVIHMLDGKISKIELISKKRRLNMEKELKESLINDKLNKGNVDKKKEIEIRDPNTFYPYLKFKTKYKLKQDLLKEKKLKRKLQRLKQKGYVHDDNINIDDIESNQFDESDNEYDIPSDFDDDEDDDDNDMKHDDGDDDNNGIMLEEEMNNKNLVKEIDGIKNNEDD